MSKIDCLVCHDTTGKYKKAPPAAGFPEKGLDLVAIAQNVGRPARANCGLNCHFRGGGGDAVKHGDMSFTLANPARDHDVHMGVDDGGLDFRCQDCNLPKDKYGKPIYAKKKGTYKWKEAVKPTYRWYSGTVKRHILGDRINQNGVTELTQPVGDFNDPASRIYPFKVHKGKQISDAVYKYLIAPQLWEGYWKHWDWDKAARDGMKSAGLAYSGKYEFVETSMFWGLTHEVAPKEQALSCAECHASLAKATYCGKCHQERPDVSFKDLVHKGINFKSLAQKGRDVVELIGKTNYIDYKALGYEGDPIEIGGRFDKLGLGVAHMGMSKAE
jgi:hypothetical protein